MKKKKRFSLGNLVCIGSHKAKILHKIIPQGCQLLMRLKFMNLDKVMGLFRSKY